NEDEIIDSCPSAVECRLLGGECINCNFNKSCVYGSEITVVCQPKRGIICSGERKFQRSMICRYCYQTYKWEHTCHGTPHCRMAGSPRPRYIANCSVHSEIICLGRRRFPKNLLCNWTSGHRWTTSLILSITLGGFGADRFYLGHWQEGIGKLFSFGGLGVWTIVDVILIAVGYLKPADGSVYIW
uniref:TM2 domain-containing protein n=1 Tax=Strigamia maritima TaxID=126957 RepID=T1J3U4_STRMM